MASIVACIAGFLSGFVTLAAYACCRASGAASRAEERGRSKSALPWILTGGRFCAPEFALIENMSFSKICIGNR